MGSRVGCAYRCRGKRPRATMRTCGDIRSPPAPGGPLMTVDEVRLSAAAGARPAGRVTAVLERPGARLVYEVTGDGPAVVLIHGFGLDMRMWDPQVEPLAARFRLVRYDCRGFGASGPFDPAVPYTHADDLVALLDHLGIGDAVLAGLSFGGRVALRSEEHTSELQSRSDLVCRLLLEKKKKKKKQFLKKKKTKKKNIKT